MAVFVPGVLSPPLDSDWRPIQHETHFAIRILNHPSFILIFNYGWRWLCWVILWPAYLKYRKMINKYIYVSLSLFQLQVEPSGSLKGEMHFQKNCLLSSPSPTRGPNYNLEAEHRHWNLPKYQVLSQDLSLSCLWGIFRKPYICVVLLCWKINYCLFCVRSPCQ